MRISDWSSDVCSSDLLDALRGGGKVSGALELGIAADLDRRPPIFLREPDQIGEGVAVPRLDAIRRDGRNRLFVVRAAIELVADPEESGVQLGRHFHRPLASALAFLASASNLDIDRKSTRLNSSH